MKINFYICIGAFFFSGMLSAQITVNVPADYPTYNYLERLEAYGCVAPSLRSFKPLAYADIQAALLLPRDPDEETEEGPPPVTACRAPEWLLQEQHLLTRPLFQNDLRVSALAFHNDLIPLHNLEASITPLYPLREGRITFNGANLYSELLVNAQTGHEWGIALAANPGWVGALDNYQNLNGRFYLQQGYVKLGYRRLELLVGRSALQLGETAHGSLLLSGATRPIDLIKLAVRPEVLPNPFGFFGPVTFQAWYSFAGTSAFVNHSHLAAVGLGMRPAAWFEWSFMELFQFGGDGRPRLGFTDVLSMLAYGGGDDFDQKRQRSAVLNLAFWAPNHWAKLYTQLMAQNLTIPSQWFNHDLSTLLGLWFPKVGAADIRLEWVRTVPSAYQNSYWGQGLTYFDSPLGTPLGADAQGFYLDAGLPPWSGWRPGVSLLYEGRALSLTGNQAPEYRYGGGVDVTKRWVNSELNVSARLAYVMNRYNVREQNAPLSAIMGTWRYSFF